jgi:hypothetical protein
VSAARWALIAALVAGCATASPSPSSPTPSTGGQPKARPQATQPAPAPAGKQLKLAILPVESDVFPRVAAGLNAHLHDIQVRGIDDYFLSKVTLEVVQLSIECVDATNACYTAVGKSLSAQRLLLAQIAPNGPRRSKSVKVTITLFDVDGGTPLRTAEQVYKTESEAVGGVEALVQQAITDGAQAKGGS